MKNPKIENSETIQKTEMVGTAPATDIAPNQGAATQPSEKEVEVLYQRMGNRWYAFSLIDDEVFVGSISLDDVDPHHPSRHQSHQALKRGP